MQDRPQKYSPPLSQKACSIASISPMNIANVASVFSLYQTDVRSRYDLYPSICFNGLPSLEAAVPPRCILACMPRREAQDTIFSG